jgi:hypothetical protein
METPADWPFDEPPNLAVITLDSIINGYKPILYVSHDEDDGGWQFLDGLDVNVEDSKIVSLLRMLRLDQSIAELADLPEGWVAWRQTLASEWIRQSRS